jgi:hypothetical protein
MAFLDNSGDIILDAVLTDTGRKRLARADGTFRIVKFALGDEEINYGTYDGSAATGQKDLPIMQTPILEAFSNNTSGMHSFLQTYTNNQTLLYLPVIRLNTLYSAVNINSQFNSYLVATDENTACGLVDTGRWDAAKDGILYGFAPNKIKTHIRLDQGIDNDNIGPSTGLPTSEMYENQYSIEYDTRFSQIIDPMGSTLAVPSFIDDDGIGVCYLSRTVNRNFVKDNTVSSNDPAVNLQVIKGARGSILGFQVLVTRQMQSTNSLFLQLGGEFDAAATGAGPLDCYYIDTVIRVTGLTTGFQIDVPIRYVKAIGAYNCTAP